MIQHLGIIMDGNRRWAKQKFLPTLMWHKAGFENAQNIIDLSVKKEIKHLTLWALSKENLVKRDQEELSGIIKLIEKLWDLLPKLQASNIRFETVGDISKLPQTSQEVLSMVKEQTKNNSAMVLTVALVYSGQDEIVRAMKKAIASGINIDVLDEKSFRTFMDTHFLPPIDLIIRTWGDIRHSGFLLYDSDYSEYFFSEKLWPDFDENELNSAIEFFCKTKRNFWK